MTKTIMGVAVFSALIMNTACATITRGTTEAFQVQTTPSGATVRTSLGMMCEPTPCVIPKVSREANFTVTIEKEGYKTGIYNVTHEMSGGGGAGMAGNVILGGGIGAIVDANTGATQQLVPNPLVVALEPLENETSGSKPSEEIIPETEEESKDEAVKSVTS